MEYTVIYKTHTGDYFELPSSNEKIVLSFEARQFQKLPSELEFAQSVLKRMRLSSLAYGIVCINKRVTYITNEVLTSRHDCVFDLFDIDLQLHKRLGNCKLFTRSCSEHPSCDYYPWATVCCTKQTHRVLKEPQCRCKLCVKDGPASSKSLCVDKISEFTFYPIPLRISCHCKCTNRLLKKLMALNHTVSKLLSLTEPHFAN